MKLSSLLLVLSLLLFLVEVHSQQTFPYISFMGQTLANHSYVNLSLVGTSDSDSVQCHTDLQRCCTGGQGIYRGDWYFPNGGRLQFSGDIYEDREAQRVDLRRHNSATSPTGLYHCDIPTDAVHDDSETPDPSVRETVYVGLYTASGGDVSISGDVTLTVNSDLNGGSPQFTLTCISTGGPATTVTWTRDSTTVTEGTEIVLNSATTATYTHTLTVTGGEDGLYRCTVSNNKPSSASAEFNVKTPLAPTGVGLQQNGEGSLLVTWTASGGAAVTGYIIYYQLEGGGEMSVTVEGRATTRTTITGLAAGTYSVTMVATSTSLPSSRTTPQTIVIVPLPGVPSVSRWTVTATSISISWTSDPVGDRYVVEWMRNTAVGCSDEDQGSTTLTDGSMTSYTIPDLEEDSEYSITVTASNDAGSSGVSNTVTAMTGEAAPSAPPPSVMVTSVTSSSITVRWGMVPCVYQNGDITGYSVQYRVMGTSGDPQTKPVSGASVTQTTLLGLMSGTTYSIEVAAVTGGTRIGTYSPPIDGVTSGVSPPTGVTAVQDGLTSILVSWSPSSDATGYRISYEGGSDREVDGSTTSLKLTGLVNGQTYTISIVATSPDKLTSSPITRQVTLVPPPVKPVVDVSTVATTPSTISFSWTVPASTTSSEVSWRPTGSARRRVVRNADGGTSANITDTTYTITDLRSATSYDITLSIFNPAGSSSTTFTLSTSEVEVSSEPSESNSSSAAAALGGVLVVVIVAGAVVVVVLLAIIFHLLRRLHRAEESANVGLELSKFEEKTDMDSDKFQTTSNEAYIAVRQTAGEGGEVEVEYETPQDLPPPTSSQPTTTAAGDYELV